MKAPEDAPKALLIMTDDVGFSASSTFGGMENRVTQAGAGYQAMHKEYFEAATTGVLCSSIAELGFLGLWTIA